MSKAMASIASAVHPHQLEVQEFSSYALVIDARAPAAYDEDHLPQAVNLPAGLMGLAPGTAAPERGRHSAASTMAVGIPHALLAHLRGLHPGAPVLVYCDRGGLDAEVWAAPLRQLGYEVDVLAGGWPNYRRWVVTGLEVLARSLLLTRLQMPPEGGQVQVLAALQDQGEQVLNVGALLGPQLAQGLHLPGEEVPSQSAFESALLHALRGLDCKRRVWIADVTWPFAQLEMPPGLRDAQARAPIVDVEVPSMVRAIVWRERLLVEDVPVSRVLEAFAVLGVSSSRAMLSRRSSLERKGQAIDALTNLIEEFIDQHHSLLCGSAKTRTVRLNSLTSANVATIVSGWTAE